MFALKFSKGLCAARTPSSGSCYKGLVSYSVRKHKFQISKRYIVTNRQQHPIDDKEINDANKCSEKEAFTNRVIFHSYYKYYGYVFSKRKSAVTKDLEYKLLKNRSIVPLSLKYILNEEERHDLLGEQKDTSQEGPELQDDPAVVLPYEVSKVRNLIEKTETVNSLSELSENQRFVEEEDFENNSVNELIRDNVRASSSSWMRDYKCFEDDDTQNEDRFELSDDLSKYGTPNMNIPMSNVPCGGCGALLHCQDPGIPGYLPSEIFSSCSVHDLRGLTCQRCHFMQHYNMALTVTVDPDHYPQLLSRIRNEKALVILLVDITDFPCSLWPGILNIIGTRRPLFVVGNKVDLLEGDGKGWVVRAKAALDAALPKQADIRYTSLISAKTGFGIEQLINKLHTVWQYKGDVYLVGCTNVGKSTLFNTLLQSDYCKVQAVDILQRATTAPWPGTTLNLLKFPILRPSGVRLFLRTQRLIEEQKREAAEKKLMMIQRKKGDLKGPVQLVGYIGRTFSNNDILDESEIDDKEQDLFSVSSSKRYEQKRNKETGYGLDPNDPNYKNSKWLYDTPGVVQRDQIIDLLTTEELIRTLPRDLIKHRVYVIKDNWTIFIAGLARLDFLSREKIMRVAVFCPKSLPITICETREADNLYRDFVGTEMFAVPSGGPDRMKFWPGLKQGCDDIVLRGVAEDVSCADIVLSNAGWISIAPEKDAICKFRAWTPDARGIHVRTTPLLPNAVKVHGKRIRGSPAYAERQDTKGTL